MIKDKFKYHLYLLSAIATLFLITSCTDSPMIVGKWREVGKTATLEFWKDGTFKAVDNQGMTVNGQYSLQENGNVRFEIYRKGSSPEIVNGNISLQGEELVLTSADSNEVNRYKKEK